MPRTCPICGKPAASRGENASFPFCSDRCRFVDLGKWLGGEYRIPGPRLGEEPEPATRPGGREEDDT